MAKALGLMPKGNKMTGQEPETELASFKLAVTTYQNAYRALQWCAEPNR
jgi:hypothetical protein